MEVETARRLGISLKRLRGWTPRTCYEYDGDRIVSSWTESEWDDDTQRGWMLALATLEAQKCPLCGGPREECQSPSADEAYDAKAVRCHRTTAMVIAAQGNHPNPEALLWLTERRSDG